MPGISRYLYTKDYYLNDCGGFDLYKKTKGRELTSVMKRCIDVGRISQDMVVLDIGCGRGELVYQLAKRAGVTYGLDYSQDALSFSKETIKQLDERERKKVRLVCADTLKLPFQDGAIDYIFCLDVFEHLSGGELKLLTQELARVLKKGGRFLIHTSPNKEYVDTGYRYWIKPVNRIIGPFSKKVFKKSLMTVDHYSQPLHINLQTPATLKRLFPVRYFKVRIYTHWIPPQSPAGYIYRMISHLWPLTLFYPFRDLFCPFLWAEGIKK